MSDSNILVSFKLQSAAGISEAIILKMEHRYGRCHTNHVTLHGCPLPGP